MGIGGKMIISLLMAMAFANLEGHWLGDGRMESTDNTFLCDFEFKVTETEEQIGVLVQRIGCDGYLFTWNPYGANIINGELFNTKTGIYAGTINQSQLRVNYTSSPESAPYIINVDKITETSVDFEMILEGTDGQKFLRAIMYKQ